MEMWNKNSGLSEAQMRHSVLGVVMLFCSYFQPQAIVCVSERCINMKGLLDLWLILPYAQFVHKEHRTEGDVYHFLF